MCSALGVFAHAPKYGLHSLEIEDLIGGVAQEVMIRRMKREVMGQLPRKRRQIVRLPQPSAADWTAAGGAIGAEPLRLAVLQWHLRTWAMWNNQSLLTPHDISHSCGGACKLLWSVWQQAAKAFQPISQANMVLSRRCIDDQLFNQPGFTE